MIVIIMYGLSLDGRWLDIRVGQRSGKPREGGVVHYTECMPILYMKVNCQGLTRSSPAEKPLTKDVLAVPGRYLVSIGVRIGLGSVKLRGL